MQINKHTKVKNLNKCNIPAFAIVVARVYFVRMKSRIIVYTILIAAVAAMGYFGYTINARKLMWLSGVGIVFLLFHLFRKREDE